MTGLSRATKRPHPLVKNDVGKMTTNPIIFKHKKLHLFHAYRYTVGLYCMQGWDKN